MPCPFPGLSCALLGRTRPSISATSVRGRPTPSPRSSLTSILGQRVTLGGLHLGGQQMTYFADLTPYAYLPDGPLMMNVGWLDREHDFSRGRVAERDVATMLELAARLSNMTRGYRLCEFCDAESPIVVEAPVRRGRVLLGNGEIHATGRSGEVYAAPTMVVHYVLAHQYLPPSVFIDALRWTAAKGEGLDSTAP